MKHVKKKIEVELEYVEFEFGEKVKFKKQFRVGTEGFTHEVFAVCEFLAPCCQHDDPTVEIVDAQGRTCCVTTEEIEPAEGE